MFPGRSGGISLYANEGWRKYTTLVGPIATFGYWIGWSVVLAIFGDLIGTLIQARWFPGATWTVWDGTVHLQLFNFIGVGCIVLVWLFNIFGVRPFAWFTYVTGALLMIPLAVFIIGPYISGDWHSSNVHWALASNQWGGVKIALVWLFLMGWSAYGIEVCATFTPEYKSRRDTRSRCAARRRSRCWSSSCCRSVSAASPASGGAAQGGTGAVGPFHTTS